ncbi:MAG: hypothetical protein GY753_04350, partial [Gammaproteobacteria bacterium]|nr:hypothetical protein [Gammaproteobacteria bacterium]
VMGSSFAGAGDTFVTRGLKPDPWIKRVGVNITTNTDSGVELKAGYDYDYSNQSAWVRARWGF